jgi:hypothetical protein
VSHDAGNGGSSGKRWCVISMRVIVLIGNSSIVLQVREV